MPDSHSSSSSEADQPTYNAVILHGILGGLIAGMVFLLAEMVVSWLSAGSLLMPLHMIASIPLQREIGEISKSAAVVAGGLYHIGFSMVLGLIGSLIVASFESVISSGTNMVILMTVYGFTLWLVNFYIFAPLLNVPSFVTDTVPLQQFLFHTFFFGTALGLYFVAAFTDRFRLPGSFRSQAHA